MKLHPDKTPITKLQSESPEVAQKQSADQGSSPFVDNRPEVFQMRVLQEAADNSPQTQAAMQLQSICDNSPRMSMVAQLQSIADNSPPPVEVAQLQDAADNHSANSKATSPKKANKTGLPDKLKTGMENLSRQSLDDVKVHRNSKKPAQLQAHAYAQGTDIHLASGQEKHLPHELAHVVQQKEGRVKPTKQMKQKVNVNDDEGLEKEADIMGAKALQLAIVEPSPNESIQNEGLQNPSTQLAANELEQNRGFNTDVAQREGDEESIQEQTSPVNHEFESMEAFQAATGLTTLGDYHWLKADRKARTGTWNTAMGNMTKDQIMGILIPFEQVRDYYIWVTKELDAKGHESRWVRGALYLVDELSDTYDEGVTSGKWCITPGKAVIPLLENLNVEIANFAITQFHRLLYGDLSANPLVGDEAYDFDKQFIEKEQGEVAQEVYEKYDGTEALETMNDLFNGTGIVGNAAERMANEIPTFPDYFQADLTDADSNYGRNQRIDVPLFMLYPDKHQVDDKHEPYVKQNTFLGIDVGKPIDLQELMDQKHVDGLGTDYLYPDYKDLDDVYETFKDVNEDIMSKEWYEQQKQ